MSEATPDPGIIARDKARDAFLRHVAEMIDFWSAPERDMPTVDRVGGIAFSILVAIDGGAAVGPYDLVPHDYVDDPEHFDIGGELHERLYDFMGGAS